MISRTCKHGSLRLRFTLENCVHASDFLCGFFPCVRLFVG